MSGKTQSMYSVVYDNDLLEASDDQNLVDELSTNLRKELLVGMLRVSIWGLRFNVTMNWEPYHYHKRNTSGVLVSSIVTNQKAHL